MRYKRVKCQSVKLSSLISVVPIDQDPPSASVSHAKAEQVPVVNAKTNVHHNTTTIVVVVLSGVIMVMRGELFLNRHTI